VFIYTHLFGTNLSPETARHVCFCENIDGLGFSQLFLLILSIPLTPSG